MDRYGTLRSVDPFPAWPRSAAPSSRASVIRLENSGAPLGTLGGRSASLADRPSRDLFDVDLHEDISDATCPRFDAKSRQRSIAVDAFRTTGDKHAPPLAPRVVDAIDLEPHHASHGTEHLRRLLGPKDDAVQVEAEVDRLRDWSARAVEDDPSDAARAQMLLALLAGQGVEDGVEPRAPEPGVREASPPASDEVVVSSAFARCTSVAVLSTAAGFCST